MSTTIERARHRANPHLEPRDPGLELLLACGIPYGVVYVIANDVVAAGMWDDYRPLDQGISELSGTSAPSKGYLLAMLPVFILLVLVLGFGVGVWKAAGRDRKLRAILLAQAALFPVWLLLSMTSPPRASSRLLRGACPPPQGGRQQQGRWSDEDGR